MEIKLRQRLIGAVVLAAIIVILVPTLFKSPKPAQKTIALSSTIPAEPVKPTIQTISKVSPADENINPNLPASIALGNDPLQNAQPNAQTAAAASDQTTAQSAPAQSATVQTTAQTTPVQSAAAQITTTVQTSSQPATAQAAPAAQQQTPLLSQADNLSPSSSTTVTQTKVSSSTTKVSAGNVSKKTQASNKAEFAAEAAETVAESMQPSAQATAWVVQLGSFSNKDNAKALEKTLRSNGFTAFSRNIKTTKGNLMRVMVGPETQHKKAEKILAKLTNELKLNGVIVPYDSLQAR